MEYSRRTVLAALAGGSTGGCLGFGPSNDQPGNNKCGEEYVDPTTDGTLAVGDQDWPAPQYGVGNTGYNPAVSTTETHCGQVRYVRELASEEDGVVGAATLRDGTVYVSRRSELLGVDAATGTPQWTVPVPHEIWTAPVVTADRAFVGTREGLVAVDVGARRVDWTVPLAETAFPAIDYPGWILSPPAVSGGQVFAGATSGQFAAIDVETGSIEWSTTARTLPDEGSPPEDANIPSFEGPPAIMDGVVVVGNWNGRLYAFDTRTGEELWRRNGAARYEPAPTVVGDTVLATTQVDLTAHRLADGSTRWQYREDPGSVALSAAVVDDTVHVAAGPAYESLSIVSLDRTDRSIDWRVPGRPQTSPSADRGTLYLGLYGNLVAIDRDTGTVAWEMKMESVASGPPIVTDGAVIALDERGYLYGVGTSGE